MTGEIDISQLRRKKKKKEKKRKKRGFSDFIRTGKVRSKKDREKDMDAYYEKKEQLKKKRF